MEISRRGFYSNINIMYEIIHQLRYRETMFIPYDEEKKAQRPIRWMNAQYIKMLQRHFDYFNFLSRPMNIYHSLAHYKNFPMFAYNWRIKSEEQKIWMDRFHEYISGYDLFLETDSDGLYPAIEDAKKLKTFLDSYKMKYSKKFSGSKGIHFIVPYEEFLHLKIPIYLHNQDDKSDLVRCFKELAVAIKDVLRLETMDTSVQDIKRVTKVGYSLDVKSGLVADVMTDNMLDKFKKKDYLPENIIKRNNHKRGMLWNNASVPKQVREQHIIKLFEDMEIKLGMYPKKKTI